MEQTTCGAPEGNTETGGQKRRGMSQAEMIANTLQQSAAAQEGNSISILHTTIQYSKPRYPQSAADSDDGGPPRSMWWREKSVKRSTISRTKNTDEDDGPAEGSLGEMRVSNGEKLGREKFALITTYPGWVVWQSYFDDHSIRDGFANIRSRL